VISDGAFLCSDRSKPRPSDYKIAKAKVRLYSEMFIDLLLSIHNICKDQMY